MFTTRKMRKSRIGLLGLERLEIRQLLAADLFAANSTVYVEELSPVDAISTDYVESSGCGIRSSGQGMAKLVVIGDHGAGKRLDEHGLPVAVSTSSSFALAAEQTAFSRSFLCMSEGNVQVRLRALWKT